MTSLAGHAGNVIISGLTAAGKTTHARLLSRRYNLGYRSESRIIDGPFAVVAAHFVRHIRPGHYRNNNKSRGPDGTNSKKPRPNRPALKYRMNPDTGRPGRVTE
jgi:hypothetical protein